MSLRVCRYAFWFVADACMRIGRGFFKFSAICIARGIEVILHGAASGVDLLSVVWADKNGLRAAPFPAD